MFEDLNIPFHGMLLDPLIEDSYGPLINCNFCSTFDETSPFLASPSYAICSGEYQLAISSNTTSLGCHAMNCYYGCLIHDIDYNYYHFSPKVIWQIFLIQHGTCYFCNVHVLPFNNSILLWGITT
jgi:hypothetical protein